MAPVPRERCRALLRVLRLYRILNETGKAWTWRELAVALRVTTRTIRRDVDVLHAAGLFTVKRRATHSGSTAVIRADGAMALNWQDDPAQDLVIEDGIPR